MKKFINLILDNLKGIIITTICGGAITILYMAYESTDLYKVIEYKAHVEKVIIPAANKANRRQDLKIKWIMNYISDEIEDKGEKKNDIAVGLRYNVRLKKFYYRDKDKYYREVFKDTVGMFYRDDTDERVRINFK